MKHSSPSEPVVVIGQVIALIDGVSSLYRHRPISAAEAAGLVRFIGDLKDRLTGVLDSL